MIKRAFAGFLLIVSSPLSPFAQNTFTINGSLRNVSAQKIYLIYTSNGHRSLDSARVQNGAYVFHDSLSIDQAVYLMDVSPLVVGNPNDGDIAQVFLVPGVLTITHIDSFSNTSFNGSDVNLAFKALLAAEKPYYTKLYALNGPFQVARASYDTTAMRTIKAEADSLQSEEDEKVFAPFARTHPSSPVALYVLELYAAQVPDAAKLQPLFDQLSPAVKGSAGGKTFQQRLTIAAKTAVGATAMDFAQPDTTGKPVNLSSFRGRYVLLDFWASWCVPCRAENPNVVAAYQKYHAKGFDILSVSLDRPNDREKWIKAIQTDHLAWTQVSDLKFWDNAAAKEYGVTAIPKNFLIDPQGKIVGSGLRGDDLAKRLSEIFGE